MKILKTREDTDTFTTEEIRDIIISSVVLGFSFTLAFFGGSERFSFLFRPGFIAYFIPTTALVLVSLSAKHVSQKNAGRAMESHVFYRLWTPGIILAILSSLLGFVIAAVGGIKVGTEYAERHGRWRINLTPKQMGILATLGPLVYISIALGFLMLSPLSPMIGGQNLFITSSEINITLALFSMIPLRPLDGEKIARWNMVIWAFLLLMSFAVLGMLKGII